MKRLCALVLVLVTCFTMGLPAQARGAKEEYEEAHAALLSYLKGDASVPIAEIVSWFAMVDYYDWAYSLKEYAICLQEIEEGNFRMIAGRITTLSRDTAFCAYLEEHGFNSLTELSIYAQAREAEAEGDYAAAISLYYETQVHDSRRRRIELPARLDKARYDEAMAHLDANTYEGALLATELFRKLAETNYADSADMAIRAEKRCEELAVLDGKYREAVALLQENTSDACTRAITLLEELAAVPYMDSEELLAGAREQLTALETGNPASPPVAAATNAPALPPVAVPVIAEEKVKSADGLFTINIFANGDCEIVSYSDEKVQDLILPGSIDEHPVTGIAGGAFNKCTQLRAISIPDSVLDIQANPFVECSNLGHIFVSNTHPKLKFRDHALFNERENRLICYVGNETEYKIPDGTASIGYDAFGKTSWLKTIAIPDSLTEIKGNPFRYLDQLRGFVISKEHPVFYVHVLNRGGNVLFNRKEATLVYFPNHMFTTYSDYSIPDDIRVIGEYAFGVTGRDVKECQMQGLRIPEGVTEIQDYAFACNILIGSTFILPESLTSIGENALARPLIFDLRVYDGSYAHQYVIDKGMKYGIYGWTYEKIDSRGYIKVGVCNGTTQISDQALAGHNAVKSITIPASVTLIGEHTFDNHKDITLYVEEGSYAHEYAFMHGLQYYFK